MALTSCPECQGAVSDQAQTCPHCGMPFRAVVSEFPSWQRTVLKVNLVLCGLGLFWAVAALGSGGTPRGTTYYVLLLSTAGIVISCIKLFYTTQANEHARRDIERLRGENLRR